MNSGLIHGIPDLANDIMELGMSTSNSGHWGSNQTQAMSETNKLLSVLKTSRWYTQETALDF